MTRAQIRAKYGITRIEHPDIANEELSDEEAVAYERAAKALAENFDKLWDDDDSGDID